MRKTFGIERGSFLHNSIPEVATMRKDHSAVSSQCFIFSLNHPGFLNHPQYRILILTWSALVILFGEVYLNLQVS